MRHNINKLLDLGDVGGAKHYIINIYLSYEKLINVSLDEKCLVNTTTCVVIVNKELCEALIPSPRCLFQPIESLLEAIDMVGVVCIHKPLGLFHKHFLLQEAIEEGTLDIHLVQFELVHTRNGQEKPNGL